MLARLHDLARFVGVTLVHSRYGEVIAEHGSRPGQLALASFGECPLFVTAVDWTRKRVLFDPLHEGTTPSLIMHEIAHVVANRHRPELCKETWEMTGWELQACMNIGVTRSRWFKEQVHAGADRRMFIYDHGVSDWIQKWTSEMSRDEVELAIDLRLMRAKLSGLVTRSGELRVLR